MSLEALRVEGAGRRFRDATAAAKIKNTVKTELEKQESMTRCVSTGAHFEFEFSWTRQKSTLGKGIVVVT